MPFTATPMFPGDLYDTTARIAEQSPARTDAQPFAASSAWSQFLESGWQAIRITEDLGGVGASVAEMAAIAEAAGRYGLPSPLVARCAVAPLLLSHSAENDAIQALLADVATGAASVAVAFDTKSAHKIIASPAGDSLRLDGQLIGVDWTEPATHVLVAAQDQHGQALLVLVEAAQLDVSEPQWLGLDDRRVVDLRLQGLAVAASHVLACGEQAQAAIDQGRALGALLIGAQVVGAIGAMVEQTIEYLHTRQQFGVALSTFQALRHKTVEMYVGYEAVRGMVRARVEAYDAGVLDAQSISLLKLYVSLTAREIAEKCIQLHGGIGMSRELPAARLAMHAIGCSLQWGDRFEHLETLSDLAMAA